MTWIKICGITNLEDALAAVEAGADAVGFVFYEKSPRNISAKNAREIATRLPEKIEKVGVIVNRTAREIVEIVNVAALTAIQQQFVFESTAQDTNRTVIGRDALPSRFQTFIAFPASFLIASEQASPHVAESLAQLRNQAGSHLPAGALETIFLDSGDSAQPGGTGKPFDWVKAVPIAEGMRRGGLKLVVAGGLTPANVAKAIHILHPWGVDVSSGVESKPGTKDHEKIRAFITAVREADKASSN